MIIDAFKASSSRQRSPNLQHLLSAIIVATAFPPMTAAQGKDLSVAKSPIAIVGGEAIYEDQLSPVAQGQLQQARQKEYELKRRALKEFVRHRLLEAKANQQGLTVDKLLDLEVDRKTTDPTPGEVEAYYLAQKDRNPRPFDEIKVGLQQALKEARIQSGREAYLESLWQQTTIVTLLKPPRVQVDYDASRVRGSPSAPVTIIEFADFNCPYCRRQEPTIDALLAKYRGKVSLGYRDFPLRGPHPRAELAAEASRCAEEQGKFWEYHDLLLQSLDDPTREGLLQSARSLKLGEKQFSDCLDTGRYKAQVEKDLQDGLRAGVSGTPGFFINGIFLEGAQPMRAFEEIIDEELLAAAQRAERK